jgi:hypothetical protein
MALPDITYINKYINDGKKETLSLRNFYESILVGNSDNADHIFKIPINDFFIKHKKELDSIVKYYSVPQSMFYKPKSVSYELYGTTELWLALLRLNEMRNITEFHQPIIKIYDVNSINDLIDIFFKREGIIS